MDRLQKKCFIVTSSLHGLLVAVLLFGSALMPARKDENNARLFTMVDLGKISDGPSGGEQNVAVPVADNPKPAVENVTPAAQPVVKPAPVVEPPVAKPPIKEPEKLVTPPQKVTPPPVIQPNDLPKPHPIKNHEPKHLTPEDLVPITSKPKPLHTPTIDKNSLKPVVRKADEKAKAAKEAADAAEKAAEKAERDQRRRAAQQFASSLRSFSKGFSTKTLVQMPSNFGGGGGGEASFNYSDVIASRYYNAWIAPVALEDDTPPVMVNVTISRSGDVVNFHILKRSGNSLMDKSIQNVLETVKYIEPFPESSHDQERTVTIQFNLKAKRSIG